MQEPQMPGSFFKCVSAAALNLQWAIYVAGVLYAGLNSVLIATNPAGCTLCPGFVCVVLESLLSSWHRKISTQLSLDVGSH